MGEDKWLFLMTLECDGNAVNEEGWDKMRCFPRRDRQAGEEPDERPNAALPDAFCSRAEAAQGRADHRSVGWIEFDCEAGEDGIENEEPFFFFFFFSPLPLSPPPRETVAAL